MLASEHGVVTPLHLALHMPFWIVLLIAMFIAASFGLILGAPTLRLRGDYLAIVTLGFGEIVPRVFKNASEWTSGANGVSALDVPSLPLWVQGPWSGDPFAIVQDFKILAPLAYYVIMVILIVICVILVRNLQRSRLGRAWMAVREDEVAAAAMGVNTTAVKLLAFSIGAAFSGFAGTFYAAKLSLVSPRTSASRCRSRSSSWSCSAVWGISQVSSWARSSSTASSSSCCRSFPSTRRAS